MVVVLLLTMKTHAAATSLVSGRIRLSSFRTRGSSLLLGSAPGGLRVVRVRINYQRLMRTAPLAGPCKHACVQAQGAHLVHLAAAATPHPPRPTPAPGLHACPQLPTRNGTPAHAAVQPTHHRPALVCPPSPTSHQQG